MYYDHRLCTIMIRMNLCNYMLCQRMRLTSLLKKEQFDLLSLFLAVLDGSEEMTHHYTLFKPLFTLCSWYTAYFIYKQIYFKLL